MSEIDLKLLENVMKLMKKFQIETLELPDGTKMVKKIHLGEALPKPNFSPAPPINLTTEEDIMFGSTSAPKLSLEDFNKFSANTPKD